jgi:multidrug efflux pump subunit AcrB
VRRSYSFSKSVERHPDAIHLFVTSYNLDTAQVLVQNRVSLAEPQLPQEVRALGVTVQKQSPDIMMVINLVSNDKNYDILYLSNCALLQVQDVLKRINGVGSIRIFGAREYSMRIWLDPARMYARRLTAGDVTAAIQAQNVQVDLGVQFADP